MPHKVVEANARLQILMSADKKARIARAAAIQQVSLSKFVTDAALREANAVIEEQTRIVVSESDFAFILELLENPPPLNEKLKAAIASLPKDQ